MKSFFLVRFIKGRVDVCRTVITEGLRQCSFWVKRGVVMWVLKSTYSKINYVMHIICSASYDKYNQHMAWSTWKRKLFTQENGAGKLSSNISLYDTLSPFGLKGQCHEMDIFLSSTNFRPFWTCADGFQGFPIAFHYPLQLILYYLHLWNYLYWKCSYWNPLQRVFSVIVRCSLLATSHGLGGFRYDFTKSLATSCKPFQCQTRHFRVFEAAYSESYYFQTTKCTVTNILDELYRAVFSFLQD